MTETTDQLVGDYRERLRAASADLPPDVRDDLLDDVEAHLADVRATSASVGDARAALDRLGRPEEVAAAARTELGGTSAAPPIDPGGPAAPAGPVWSPDAPPGAGGASLGLRRTLDVTAVLVVLLGAVVGLLVGGLVGALVGWALGLALLWSSPTWSAWHKTLATLVLPGGLAAPGLLASVATQWCVSEGGVDAVEVCTGFAFAPVVGVPLLIVTVAAPVVVASVLLRRATRRT